MSTTTTNEEPWLMEARCMAFYGHDTLSFRNVPGVTPTRNTVTKRCTCWDEIRLTGDDAYRDGWCEACGYRVWRGDWKCYVIIAPGQPDRRLTACIDCGAETKNKRCKTCGDCYFRHVVHCDCMKWPCEYKEMGIRYHTCRLCFPHPCRCSPWPCSCCGEYK